MTKPAEQLFDQELELLSELVKADEGIPEAAHSIQPRTLRLIMIMRSARAYLRHDLVLASAELDEVRQYDEAHGAVSHSWLDPVYLVYHATILFAFLTDTDEDGERDWKIDNRMALLDQTINLLSKVIQLDQQVHCLTPGHSLLEKLAHCYAMRDMLNKDAASCPRPGQVLDAAAYEYVSHWQENACSGSSLVNTVTPDMRAAIRTLIIDSNFQQAIHLTHHTYGIGNSAVLHKFDEGHHKEWVGTFGITCSQRTPRIGPGQFNAASFDIDQELFDGISDILLAETLAHEDTHRHQFWHLGHINMTQAKIDFSSADYERMVDIHNLQVTFMEVCAYFSEVGTLQLCIDHLECTSAQVDFLKQTQPDMRAEAAEYLAQLLSSLPVTFGDPSPFTLAQLTHLSVCESFMGRLWKAGTCRMDTWSRDMRSRCIRHSTRTTKRSSHRMRIPSHHHRHHDEYEQSNISAHRPYSFDHRPFVVPL